MEAGEFFSILNESSLERAFGWYFLGPLPWFVFALSTVCLFVIAAYVCAQPKCSSAHSSSEVSRLEILQIVILQTNPIIGLQIEVLFIACIGWLGPLTVLILKYDPSKLIMRMHTEVNSLFDLTPLGVQFVVDYLYWAVVLSVITLLALTAMAMAVTWRELYLSIPQIVGALDGDKIPLPRVAKIRVIFLIIVFAGTMSVVATFISRVDVRSLSPESPPFPPSLICVQNPQSIVVWQEWHQQQSSISKYRSSVELGLRLRNGQSNVKQNRISCLHLRYDNVDLGCMSVRSEPQFDPLNIVVIPLFPHASSELEAQFSSLALVEFLSSFNLNGSMTMDRIMWHFPSDKPSEFKDQTTWAKGAGNTFYRYLMQGSSTKPPDVFLPRNLNKVMEMLPERDETISGQDEVSTVLLLYRWNPNPALEYPRQTSNEDELNSFIAAALQKSISVWIVDLVQFVAFDTQRDVEDSGATYFQIPIPVNILTDEMEINLTGVRNSLRNQEVSVLVDGLRSTYSLQFDANRVWALRDSSGLFIAEDSGACIYYIAPGDGISGNPQKSGNSDGGALHLTGRVSLFCMIVFNSVFPVVMLLVVLIRMVRWFDLKASPK